MLFEIAILEVKPGKPKIDDAEPQERLVLGPVCVCAPDAQNAAIRAVLDHAAEISLIKREWMQVLVRPFA